MGTVQYSLAAFAVLAALFSATRYVFTTKVLPATPYSTLVAPDVFHRLGYFTVADVTAPTYTFLVRTGQDYVLVDAGSPGREHTDDFMMAVKEAVGDGTLRLLLLTHGHIDHAGMVPELARAYPKLQVVMHALEEPYVAGGVRGLVACCMHDIPCMHIAGGWVLVPSHHSVVQAGKGMPRHRRQSWHTSSYSQPLR